MSEAPPKVLYLTFQVRP